MRRAIIFLVVVLTANTVLAQSATTVTIIVKNRDTKANIAEATVRLKGTEVSAVTDINGRAELRIAADGDQTIEIFSPGFETLELKLTYPLTDPSERVAFLEINNEVGEVTITSTRTGREIESEPSRVEAIDEEEIDEKINMRPANVSMVLHESTGIQVQQTSATSNTQSVRIQGLYGRYTQILKDGFPAFGGFSGSLSILEIPPLDLKQVEVVKGPAATLFGGDAIAGVVNFVTKDPTDEPVTTLILNQTSAYGTDFSVFNSRKYSRFGYTLHGSTNYQRPYDVDDDDFTELPQTTAFGFRPKLLFYIDQKTTLTVGNSMSYQNRKGGDTFVLNGNATAFHQYFEQNRSFRNITSFNLNREFATGGRLFAKQSLAFFDRELTTQSYVFKGSQFNSFTDISYAQAFGRHAVVFGGSVVYDQFREKTTNGIDPRDETRSTVGVFVQDTVDLTDRFSLEAGFRLDYSKDHGVFALPRVSLLYRFSEHLTTRVGFGLGYKTPTMFTEDAETLLFRNVSPVDELLKAERSKGGTFDVNYKDSIGENFTYSLNQMFFYTEITDPIILRPDTNNIFRFSNAPSLVISKGFETNARVGYSITKLFFGYTFTDAKAGFLTGDHTLTLLPRHRVNSSLVFEKHESFKAGVEFYYGSRQTLDDRSLTRSTAELGLFGEKSFGKFSLFINAENLTDVRQGRYGRVVLGTHQNPTFAELYTHTEGRIFNGGIKIRL
ncbi:MAG: TonB-dependent receptor [Acidobacteria bacterium]|nr:TonB-dependent receptor [Acidobacteriota bacterium]